MTNYEVLLDSDAFVGLQLTYDALHERTQRLFELIAEQQIPVVTTNLVVAESATVISHKANQIVASSFVSEVAQYSTIFVDDDLFNESLYLFTQQTKKGTSFVDCANVLTMRKYKIPYIFSFDQAYPKQFGVKLLEEMLV